MTATLPQPIKNYFTADASDGATIVNCFTDNAVVKDEGQTHIGPEAIQQWKENASAKYDYTCQPLSSEQQDGKVVVTCRLTGNFPGSPADLRFRFELEGDRITSLDIAP
ncbi:nuclear transport factor 2 family protein [Bremerella sp. JC817]|uniref:nuclear transport factor 2 family protein n=1 Tax=Bremerella sp. JC817 TaxID=3231756 RepID=UPI003459F472